MIEKIDAWNGRRLKLLCIVGHAVGRVEIMGQRSVLRAEVFTDPGRR
ncbi:MAG TPA: hypothetical protein GX507_07005 [Clostridia bacterium]|nr:hypothetical protein [Clostridia bacterium]